MHAHEGQKVITKAHHERIVLSIETNLLTKFQEDWTFNVASRELAMQMLTTHDARRTTDKRRSQKLTMSTLCSVDVIWNKFLAQGNSSGTSRPLSQRPTIRPLLSHG
ncbi:hypothetical protein DPMN_119539 [Dreissena polymorpha]|uniref:Uncharacterized protein n=1 Tax=Dreissena polymorpha TaxID=45954 RepID=A0A9D4JPH4_DREPO|nr:hypothetical protein DPMN_119539 [Dreissena polymorpha]